MGCGGSMNSAGCVAKRWIGAAVALVVVTGAGVPYPAGADTLEGSLSYAYANNPTLNAQRASVRATDETVPQALSGYRPRVSLSASLGEQYVDTLTRSTSGPALPTRTFGTNVVHNYGGTLTQTLYNGKIGRAHV